jgi:hypothetical protein
MSTSENTIEHPLGPLIPGTGRRSPLSRPPHSEKYTLPFVALLTIRGPWQVSVTRSHDPEFSFHQKNPNLLRKRGLEYRADFDAFAVTTEFLDLKSSEDALRFFQKYGPFQFTRNGAKKRRTEPVRWSLVQRAQSEFNEALTGDSIPANLYEFVFQPLKVELRFRAVAPELLKADPSWIEDAAIADCDDVVSALRASVFLKRMKGFRWKRCARKECNQLFQTIDPRKIYHSPECAHLKAVNDYNARRKNKKGKRRK